MGGGGLWQFFWYGGAEAPFHFVFFSNDSAMRIALFSHSFTLFVGGGSDAGLVEKCGSMRYTMPTDLAGASVKVSCGVKLVLVGLK